MMDLMGEGVGKTLRGISIHIWGRKPRLPIFATVRNLQIYDSKEIIFLHTLVQEGRGLLKGKGGLKVVFLSVHTLWMILGEF